jgi:hypothetical protein
VIYDLFTRKGSNSIVRPTCRFVYSYLDLHREWISQLLHMLEHDSYQHSSMAQKSALLIKADFERVGLSLTDVFTCIIIERASPGHLSAPIPNIAG